MMNNAVSVLFTLGFSLATFNAVSGAEIKILSGVNFSPILNELRGNFEKASGLKLTVQYATARQVRDRVQNGEAVDVVIAIESFVEPLSKSGKVDSPTKIANSIIGVVIKAGAQKPDVSNAEALKKTLLTAKS